jgi:hypothetical protein
MHRKRDDFIEEAKGRQRNIVFPDTVRNARSVDAYLWRGSPDAPLVQRIGAWLFGLTFIGIGALFFNIGYWDRSFVYNLLAILSVLVGLKIFLNGCKRRKRTNSP